MSAAAMLATQATKDREKGEKIQEKAVQMPFQSFLYNWKQNMSITVSMAQNRNASLRDIDISLSPSHRSGSATPRSGVATPR